MKKIYKSRTIPHFGVGARRVSFVAMGRGGSYFETTDEALQRGLESHPWYGKKFYLAETIGEIEKGAAMADEGVAEAVAPSADEVAKEELAFATLSEAKDWLADTFDVSRGAIRSIAQAKEAALSRGYAITVASEQKG